MYHRILTTCLIISLCLVFAVVTSTGCFPIVTSEHTTDYSRAIPYVESITYPTTVKAGTTVDFILTVSTLASPGLLYNSEMAFIRSDHSPWLSVGITDGRYQAGEFFGLSINRKSLIAGSGSNSGSPGAPGTVFTLSKKLDQAGVYILYIGSTRLREAGGSRYDFTAPGAPDKPDFYPPESDAIEYRKLTVTVTP